MKRAVQETPVAMQGDKFWNAVRDGIAHLGVLEEEVLPESELVAALSLDSLDCVELVMELEEKFSIEISEEAAEQWKTAGDVAAYLRKRA